METNPTKQTQIDIESKDSGYENLLESRNKINLPEMEAKQAVQMKNKQTEQPIYKEKVKKQPIATYKFEEVLEQTTLYFKGDTLAASVWINKYALKDSAGNIYERTPDDMHRRIAKEIARIEKRYPNSMNEAEIFDLLQNFKYIIPQGSPMAGIGNNFQIGSLYNCFVIGNNGNSDSYGGIMKVDE